MDILGFLRDNGVEEATESDCHLIVKYYTADAQFGAMRSLRYSDFLQIVLPCDHQYLRADVAQRPTFEVPKHQKLGPNVEQELTFLLEKEIALNRVVEDIR